MKNFQINRREFIFGAAACGICASTGFAHATDSSRTLNLSNATLCADSPFPKWGGTIDVKPASDKAQKILNWMTHTLGIDGNFELLSAKIDRWAGFASLHKRYEGRFIVYDEEYVDWSVDQPDWSASLLLGHEIGHHLNGDTNFVSPHGRASWDRELAADRTSGFVNARLGAPLNAIEAYASRYSIEGTETHPPRHMRRAAYVAGWHQANNLMKWEEQPMCTNKYLSEPLDINGSSCRLVQHCDSSPEPQLACKNLMGDWIIK